MLTTHVVSQGLAEEITIPKATKAAILRKIGWTNGNIDDGASCPRALTKYELDLSCYVDSLEET